MRGGDLGSCSELLDDSRANTVKAQACVEISNVQWIAVAKSGDLTTIASPTSAAQAQVNEAR